MPAEAPMSREETEVTRNYKRNQSQFKPLVTAGTWILAFILQEPLLAFTGTTPKKDDPLIDIHQVIQNHKSLSM